MAAINEAGNEASNDRAKMVDNASSTGASTRVVPQPLVDNEALQDQAVQVITTNYKNAVEDRSSICNMVSES